MKNGSAGILTCCPSVTHLCITLGATNPWLIVIAKETLGFRCTGLSPVLRLLMPTFSLPNAPARLTPTPSQQLGTLPYHLRTSQRRQCFLHCRKLNLVGIRRFELRASSLSVTRSTMLSYMPTSKFNLNLKIEAGGWMTSLPAYLLITQSGVRQFELRQHNFPL